MWLLAGAVLVVALVTSVIWAARSEAGTRWLLDHVPGLSVQGVRGSLWGDALAIDRCAGKVWPHNRSVQVDGLALQQPSWRLLPHAGAWLSLSSPSLKARARGVALAARRAGPAGGPLSQLRLPFALSVDGAGGG